MKKYIIILSAMLIASTMVATAQNKTKKYKMQGVEMVETLSDDGTSLVKRPYRWFAAMASADNEAVAIEMAQMEAQSAVSRVIESTVTTQAERANIVVDGKVASALKSHWEQMSFSIQQACEPFGEVESTYNTQTGMYEVIAKVGIRGDRYIKMLDGAKDVKPAGLSGDDLKQFLDANKSIIDAAKGN